MKYLFTFIVVYQHRPDRFKNLQKVLNWVNGFSNVEIIVVEQDKKSKLDSLSFSGFRHIFVENKTIPFNRSWGFNVGLQYAQSENIVFSDCDLLMDPYEFIEGLKLISKDYDCVSPYKEVIDLEPQEINYNFDQLKQIKRPSRGGINLAGGMIMFKRKAIEEIGGWDENFIGWGGEDDFQNIKIRKFLKWKELDYKCYHLWHHRVQPDNYYYQRNLKILQELKSLDDVRLKSYINNNKNIGRKNKFCE